MVEGPEIGGAEEQLSERTSPERLMREAISLALILGLTLSVSALERRGWVPWQGFLSSLLLLGLCLWHGVHFRLGFRFLCPPKGSRVLSAVFPALLVPALLFCADTPLATKLGYTTSPYRLLHLILIVPLCEELYFRGLLLEHLRRGFSAVHAVVLCTALFALLHFPVGALLPAGVLSLISCILVLRSGSLFHAFQLHIAWNAITQISRMGDDEERWFWAIVASSVIVLLAAGSFWKRPRDD